MSGYCLAAQQNILLQNHHDTEHGFPCLDDNRLFEFYCLEIAQAGLSWQTIMKKQRGMRCAFDNFDVAKVAAYQETDIARLMQTKDVIKYRLKIEAMIGNARAILNLQKEHGSFADWLALQHHHIQQVISERECSTVVAKITLAKELWVKALKKQFKFVGNEIVQEFLMGIAYLPNAHDCDCPIYHFICQKFPDLPYYDFMR